MDGRDLVAGVVIPAEVRQDFARARLHGLGADAVAEAVVGVGGGRDRGARGVFQNLLVDEASGRVRDLPEALGAVLDLRGTIVLVDGPGVSAPFGVAEPYRIVRRVKRVGLRLPRRAAHRDQFGAGRPLPDVVVHGL